MSGTRTAERNRQWRRALRKAADLLRRVSQLRHAHGGRELPTLDLLDEARTLAKEIDACL